MVDIPTVTTFLGWCAVMNIGILFFTAFWLVAFRDFTKRVHSSLLGVDQDILDAAYIQFMGNLKIAVLVFNVVPYLALKIMA